MTYLPIPTNHFYSDVAKIRTYIGVGVGSRYSYIPAHIMYLQIYYGGVPTY